MLPLAEPVRFAPRLPTPNQLAAFLAEAAPFSESVSLDRWLLALSEPVRFKPALGTASQPSLAFVKAASFAESVSLDRWLIALSEPVRFAPSLRTASQQAGAWGTFTPATVETITLDKWYPPLAEPVRFRIFPTTQQQAFALVKGAPFAETVYLDKWFEALSEPARVPLGQLRTTAEIASGAAFNPQSLPNPAPMSTWFLALGEPARFPKALGTSSQPAFALVEAAPFGEIVTLDKWFRPLSEPNALLIRRPFFDWNGFVSVVMQTTTTEIGKRWIAKEAARLFIATAPRWSRNPKVDS
jgi:hypothetical protein